MCTRGCRYQSRGKEQMMSKYTKSEEMIVCEGDKITFENKSDSNYLVSAGVIFEKSGLYNVLVESKRTVISKVADSQTDWIPCSERLPSRFGKVLCTFIPSGGNLWTTVIIANYSDLMGIASPCFWVGEVGKNSFTDITEQVKAWMPLPEPYKGGE